MVLGLVEDESISLDELRAIERRIDTALTLEPPPPAASPAPAAPRARRKERRS